MTDHLYAEKGQTLTCTNGHEVAVATKDISHRAVVSIHDFYWVQPAPKPDSLISKTACSICSAPFIAGLGLGVYMHTEEGWRVSDDKTKQELKKLYGG